LLDSLLQELQKTSDKGMSVARSLVLAGRLLQPAVNTLAPRTLTVIPSRTFFDNAGWKRWAFNAAGFNQFGLYHDDALHESPEVKEALSRLPQDLLDGRAFRIQRALHCSMLKTVLPKDQWPTYEEDREKGRYLQPYLKEVQAEKAEKEAWGN